MPCAGVGTLKEEGWYQSLKDTLVQHTVRHSTRAPLHLLVASGLASGVPAQGLQLKSD